MSINVSEVIWTIICFFVLLFVLKKFLFHPLVTFMDERQARIDEGAAAKQQSDERIRKNDAALEESWKARNDEAKALLNSGKTEAEALRAKNVAQAHAQAHEQEKEARERMKAEREETLAQAEQKVPELVELLSAQLMGEAK